MIEPFYRRYRTFTVGQMMALLSSLPLDAVVTVGIEGESSWMVESPPRRSRWSVRSPVGIGYFPSIPWGQHSRLLNPTEADAHTTAARGSGQPPKPIETLMIVYAKSENGAGWER